jgi:hypothetical protein
LNSISQPFGQPPVGLEESQRKSDWVRQILRILKANGYSPKKRRNMNRPDAFAADFLQVRQAARSTGLADSP